MQLRGPNLFFKYFYFLFGPGLFYPLRVPAKVHIFFGSLAEPLTLLHPKMELLRHREPRELETMGFLQTAQKNSNLSGHPKELVPKKEIKIFEK